MKKRVDGQSIHATAADFGMNECTLQKHLKNATYHLLNQTHLPLHFSYVFARYIRSFQNLQQLCGYANRHQLGFSLARTYPDERQAYGTLLWLYPMN